jgi:Icc-related predicted phosphoesterase
VAIAVKSRTIVKILAVSDAVEHLVYSPQIAERFADIDLVVSCGDLSFEYLEYIVTMLSKPLYYVYGNHSFQPVLRADGEYRHSPEGCINIHRRVINHRGLLMAGLEGSLCYSAAEHQYSQTQMAVLARSLAPRLWLNQLRYGRALDILVTHAPPQGIHDGEDLCHQGFKPFLDFMDRYKPRYLLHGHTHLYRLDAVRETRYGDTTVLNAFGYQVIEIPDDTLVARC